MRILVCPMNLAVGGSQIIGIELAAAVRDLGHQVVICSYDGPLRELAADRGLREVAFPRSARPSAIMRKVVRRGSFDLVHTYERSMTLQAFLGVGAFFGVPVVASIMTMGVPRGLPTSVPLIVGTRQLHDDVRRWWPGTVSLIEPPVNTSEDRPGAVDPAPFVERLGLGERSTNVVLVSRLSSVMKLEGVIATIDATAALASEADVRLVIVGDGPARAAVERRAEQANDLVGRDVVVLAGMMTDPRPAYEFADIVVGQSTAVLRGMAFEKPGIVLGEDGFSEIVSPESMDHFRRVGLYGLGDGAFNGRLEKQLRSLVTDDERRSQLGRFGRRAVNDHWALERGAEVLERIYRDAVGSPAPVLTRAREAVVVGAGVIARRMSGRGGQVRQGRDRMRIVETRERRWFRARPRLDEPLTRREDHLEDSELSYGWTVSRTQSPYAERTMTPLRRSATMPIALGTA